MIDRCSGCQAEPPRGLPALGEIYALRTAEDRTRHYWPCDECAKGNTFDSTALEKCSLSVGSLPRPRR